MKTKYWMVALALVVLVVCGAAVLGYAQEAAAAPEGGWHGHGQHHMAWMAKELNLTDAQKDAGQVHSAVAEGDAASADAADGAKSRGHAGRNRQRRL